MAYLIVLFVLLSSRMGTPHKCRDDIVDGISDLWKGIESGGLLREFESSGYCIVVAGTTGLLQDEDSIERLGARFYGNSVENRHLYKNGTLKVFPQFKVVDDIGRHILTKDQRGYVYYLPFDRTNGVVGEYLCEDTGDSGTPRGNIVIFSSEYNKDAVTEMKKTLASVNIFVNKTYPDTFPGIVYKADID